MEKHRMRKQAQRGIKRFVALYDQHYPYQIPAYYNPQKDESPLFNFLRDFDPHILIDGGDQLDLDVIAHWNKGKPRITEGKRLKHAYDGYNTLLTKREKHLKSLEKWAFLMGNHEAWIEDMLDEQPALEGLVDISANLSLAARGAQVIEQRKHFKVGHLHFLHGDYKKGYAATYTAKAIAGIYGKSIVYGHFHANQVYSAVTPFDELPYQVTGVGCLCNLNPMWKRNEASAWVNSFCYGYVSPNGNYQLYTTNIVDNQFIVNGQIYK